MGTWTWIFAAFGLILIMAASFAFVDPSLSPAMQAQHETNGFQIILGIAGLVAIIAGIVKGGS
jgi:uncharacterized membrane protein YphA (DoxX/SURF4 family)